MTYILLTIGWMFLLIDLNGHGKFCSPPKFQSHPLQVCEVKPCWGLCLLCNPGIICRPVKSFNCIVRRLNYGSPTHRASSLHMGNIPQLRNSPSQSSGSCLKASIWGWMGSAAKKRRFSISIPATKVHLDSSAVARKPRPWNHFFPLYVLSQCVLQHNT